MNHVIMDKIDILGISSFYFFESSNRLEQFYEVFEKVKIKAKFHLPQLYTN